MPTETIIRYTTAEPDYDYSYTTHMGVVGYTDRDRPVRKVHIEKGREDDQCARYGTALGAPMTHLQFADCVEAGFIILAKVVKVDAVRIAAVLSGMGDALAEITAEREEIDADRKATKADDQFMLGALEGREASLQATGQVFETLRTLLIEAGV